MPGFLGRDLCKCKTFAANWYANKLQTEEMTVSHKPLQLHEAVA